MVVICGPSFTKSLQYFFNEIQYKFFCQRNTKLPSS